ncbi:MAG: hypothetical protein OEY51_14675 [Cyclobacteriaceae bacterium]|nr:hypothetical protein [Cyclobacteriaceae bacterium]
MLVVWMPLLFLIAGSCIELGFERAQPLGKSNITDIPDSWKGHWLLEEEDTIIISDNFIGALKDSLQFSQKDSLIIRKQSGWYYLNIKRHTQSYWTLFCLQKKGDELFVLTPEIDEEDSTGLRPFDMHILYDHAGQIQSFVIDPEPSDWKKLLKSSFFSTYQLRRIK